MTRGTSLCLFIVALFCIHQGIVRYGFWENNMPGSGFLPVVACVILAVCSCYIFVKNGKQTIVFKKKHLYPVIGSVLLIGSIQFLGMILSILIFMIVWLVVIEKFLFSRAAIYGIATTLLIYFIFKVSLNVRLPEGIIGI
ncbi:tripartite tricarboxylate transporter TctB family protein [Halalkalibacter krulwichiae]|uniref:Tripartite tricarboxylate transporter TctB family protein n=1 Tax=Halalkalibacter krulwichiae TaxID=199441 RepID=A0A1X9MBC2_9BACI|nr:tripartite tricarboxylate transporter TctB family protein [Halalkalibacter krulwichiae]ARK28871.1 Tripartite tricarboxylate transporter TctB family protein [Halalkalibacter krulwichiae]